MLSLHSTRHETWEDHGFLSPEYLNSVHLFPNAVEFILALFMHLSELFLHFDRRSRTKAFQRTIASAMWSFFLVQWRASLLSSRSSIPTPSSLCPFPTAGPCSFSAASATSLSPLGFRQLRVFMKKMLSCSRLHQWIPARGSPSRGKEFVYRQHCRASRWDAFRLDANETDAVCKLHAVYGISVLSCGDDVASPCEPLPVEEGPCVDTTAVLLFQSLPICHAYISSAPHFRFVFLLMSGSWTLVFLLLSVWLRAEHWNEIADVVILDVLLYTFWVVFCKLTFFWIFQQDHESSLSVTTVDGAFLDASSFHQIWSFRQVRSCLILWTDRIYVSFSWTTH